MKDIASAIINNKTSLGIELGSTRIKAVLISEEYTPIASGTYSWENKLEDGVWTYDLSDVWTGVQACFKELRAEVERLYATPLVSVGSLGISAMMHGYLVFNENEEQLVPFRTWRNTTTEQAAIELTKEFEFNVPQRWSVSHVYQAILNGESHINDISFMTTLSGYVHWKLTGEKVLGVGDASGMFPIDSNINTYDVSMIEKFDSNVSDKGIKWNLSNILPKVLSAGESAGVLSEEGAKLIDPTGQLQAGIPLCPPEGDAGTGMVATNSVAECTGNVSAGTSIFAMIVLEKTLSKVYVEIDMVTTPSGKPVAMVHCNNCTADIDTWVKIFGETMEQFGHPVGMDELYSTLYKKALEADSDCGELLTFNYLSGEPITEFEEGRPLLVRGANSRFTVANIMRSLIFSAVATLKLGMDILTEKENVTLEQLLGHGGLFKTKEVGQRLMAGALEVPVTVMESASEGGAWGIALLASYMSLKEDNETLEEFLSKRVFEKLDGTKLEPLEEDINSFKSFISNYVKGLNIEKSAVENFDWSDK